MSSRQWDSRPMESPSSPTLLSSETSFILAVGRLAWEKGFDRLMMSFWPAAIQGLRLAILGEGPERTRLELLARDLGIIDHVHLPGWVTDVELWYQSAECFVLSSHHESFGNVILEAMANRCPVVSFDCQYGPRELIQHEENGLLVPNGDIDGLTEAFLRVLNNDELRAKLINNGLATAHEHRIEKVAAKWLR